MANKLKTHKGLSKVLKVRKGGSVKYQPANHNHKATNKSSVSKRSSHHAKNIHSSDLKRVNVLINK